MATPQKNAGLWRHTNGTYYFRERVPAHLIDVIGRKLFSTSLGTRDRRTALPLWREERNRVDQLIASAQHQINLGRTDQHRVAGAIYRQELSALADAPDLAAGTTAAIAELLEHGLGNRPAGELSEAAESLAVGIGREPLLQLITELQALCTTAINTNLQQQGLIATDASATAAGQTLAAKVPSLLRDMAQIQQGDFRPSSTAAAFPDGPITAAAPKPKKRSEGLGGDELIAQWITARQPRGGAISHSRTYMRELLAYAETAVPLMITNAQVKQWKLHLLSAGTLKLNSVKARFRALSIIYGVAVELDQISTNPFSNLGRWPKAGARSSRRSFTTDEALKILAAAKAKGGWLWWVNLLACTTGARIRELAQLRTIDLVERDGITCINFTHQPDHQWPTTLKNDATARLLPVPQPLIDAGFLKWAQQQPAGYLFTGRRGMPIIGSCSQTAGALIRSAGVDDPDAVFHSWRHRFEDDLRNTSGISYAVAQAISGRTTTGSERFYGGGASPATLKEAMDLIDVAWLRPLLG